MNTNKYGVFADLSISLIRLTTVQNIKPPDTRTNEIARFIVKGHLVNVN